MPNIKIVGTGLLGTSLGLALARQGIVAQLVDNSKSALRLAIEYGAGVEAHSEPDLVVVCVPPDSTAEIVIEQLRQHPSAFVTDVASVKAEIARQVAESGLGERYVGSHPMAGREKGGPAAGRADLFFARPWVICPRVESSSEGAEFIRDLAIKVGALPVVLSPEDHDQAVAVVSHLPQLMSSALAAQLTSGTEQSLGLSGQGLRDSSRIAASDPELWVQIISQNSKALLPLVSSVRADLERLENALSDISAPGALATVHELLNRGNVGVSRIPGKHGGKFANYSLVTVMIDDAPGALASLFMFIGQIGVNIEDFKLEHSPGAPIGLVEIQVLPQSAEHLVAKLSENGWRLV